MILIIFATSLLDPQLWNILFLLHQTQDLSSVSNRFKIMILKNAKFTHIHILYFYIRNKVYIVWKIETVLERKETVSDSFILLYFHKKTLHKTKETRYSYAIEMQNHQDKCFCLLPCPLHWHVGVVSSAQTTTEWSRVVSSSSFILFYSSIIFFLCSSSIYQFCVES